MGYDIRGSELSTLECDNRLDWCFPIVCKNLLISDLTFCELTLLTKYINPVILHCLKHWIFVAYNTDYAYTLGLRFHFYRGGSEQTRVSYTNVLCRYLFKSYGS